MSQTPRVYSLISVKSINEEQRTITGLATTPTPDRVGDIVEPKGAKFNLPIPLLWQHHHDQPIGHVTKAEPTPQGILITARLAKVDEPGKLQDRLDEAWHAIKAGLVRGLSIGFRAIEHSLLPSGGVHFLKWEWLELSAVTVPANAQASIQSIKRYDAAHLAAKKPAPVVRLDGAKPSTTKLSSLSDKEARAMVRKDPGLLLGGMLAAIEQLRKEIAESAIDYKGIWSAAATYRRNAAVTHGGSLWIAKGEVTGEAPGKSGNWQMAVKRGRDGRDAR